MQHHKYSLTEIEFMMPWEREIYVAMLKKWVEDENMRVEQENRKAAARQEEDRTATINGR